MSSRLLQNFGPVAVVMRSVSSIKHKFPPYLEDFSPFFFNFNGHNGLFGMVYDDRTKARNTVISGT